MLRPLACMLRHLSPPLLLLLLLPGRGTHWLSWAGRRMIVKVSTTLSPVWLRDR
jgi:hypothetical protein